MCVCSYSTTVQIYCSVGLYTVQCRSTVLYCILLFVVIFICLNKCAGGIPCLWHHLVGRKKFIIVFYMGIKKSWLYALSRDGGSHSFIIFVPKINLAKSTCRPCYDIGVFLLHEFELDENIVRRGCPDVTSVRFAKKDARICLTKNSRWPNFEGKCDPGGCRHSQPEWDIRRDKWR